MKIHIVAILALTIACTLHAEPSSDAIKIIRLLGIDAVFSDTHYGPFPEAMKRDMDAKGLSQEKIASELATALERDFSPSEIKDFAAFLEGPIWTKFKQSDSSISKDTSSELSKALSEVSRRWNEYMADKTLPERKEK